MGLALLLVLLPREDWPDNIPLLYFSYHINGGPWHHHAGGDGGQRSGALAEESVSPPRIAVDSDAVISVSIHRSTFGWMTTELGRQPWLIYGIMRTAEGTSPHVTGGNSLFTLLGFMGIYPIPGVLFLALIWREIDHGPARSELAAPALTHY
jgi:cytochrome d ubiquinol oxidase subunit I